MGPTPVVSESPDVLHGAPINDGADAEVAVPPVPPLRGVAEPRSCQ